MLKIKFMERKAQVWHMIGSMMERGDILPPATGRWTTVTMAPAALVFPAMEGP